MKKNDDAVAHGPGALRTRRSARRFAALATVTLILAVTPDALTPSVARAAATTTTTTVTTTTTTTTTPTTLHTYVALGDSFSSGEGLAPYVGPDHDHCNRSRRSYPYLVAGTADLAPSAFVDVACSGARLANYARSVRGEAPQIRAVTPGTDLVSMTGGGNDLNFVELALNCLSFGVGRDLRQPRASACRHWITVAQRLLGVARLVPGSRTPPRAPATSPLETLYERQVALIRSRQGTSDPATGQATWLAVLNYPEILPASVSVGRPCVVGPGLAYSGPDSVLLRTINHLLDLEIAAAVAHYRATSGDAGVLVVNVVTHLRPLSCRLAGGDSDIRAMDLAHPARSLHPLASGEAKMAIALVATMAAHGVAP